MTEPLTIDNVWHRVVKQQKEINELWVEIGAIKERRG